MGRRRIAIDSHDARALRGPSLRTRIVRVALALAAVALLAAAAASARSLEVHPKGLLPTGTTGIVVADLSLSIGDENLQDARRALQQVVDANEPIGFVVFSDVPYELLPPGTPAKELRPILRLLAPRKGHLAHPWQQEYRAGTKISEALELAQSIIRRDRVSPASVLLLSDLDTAPDDYNALARTLQSLRRDVRVRVVPLAATSEGRQLFAGVLGESVFTEPSELSERPPEDSGSGVRGGTPVGLLILGGLCFAALAAHERFGSRLALPAAKRPVRDSGPVEAVRGNREVPPTGEGNVARRIAARLAGSSS